MELTATDFDWSNGTHKRVNTRAGPPVRPAVTVAPGTKLGKLSSLRAEGRNCGVHFGEWQRLGGRDSMWQAASGIRRSPREVYYALVRIFIYCSLTK